MEKKTHYFQLQCQSAQIPDFIDFAFQLFYGTQKEHARSYTHVRTHVHTHTHSLSEDSAGAWEHETALWRDAEDNRQFVLGLMQGHSAKVR